MCNMIGLQLLMLLQNVGKCLELFPKAKSCSQLKDIKFTFWLLYSSDSNHILEAGIRKFKDIFSLKKESNPSIITIVDTFNR